ncbi:MAG: RNA polymerase sigma factor [Bacteroidota bacterium]
MKSQSKIRKLTDQLSREARFRLVFDELFTDLFIYAKSLTKSEDLAKDAVSEVFLTLWATNSDLTGILKIKSYLLVSVRNECLRQIYESTSIDEANTIEHVDKINPEDVLLEKELKEKLDKIVSALPDKCQLVFEQCVLQKKSHKEVAEELGISVSTVSSQLSNALKAIRIEISSTYESTAYDSYSNIMLSLVGLLFPII